jgi:hypothetical protein
MRPVNPIVRAGPLKNLVALAAMCPASSWRAALLQHCIKLGSEGLGADDWPIPTARSRLGRRPGAVHNDNRFLL